MTTILARMKTVWSALAGSLKAVGQWFVYALTYFAGRASGMSGERAKALGAILSSRNRQDEAAAEAPRSKEELLRRMREGKL